MYIVKMKFDIFKSFFKKSFFGMDMVEKQRFLQVREK